MLRIGIAELTILPNVPGIANAEMPMIINAIKSIKYKIKIISAFNKSSFDIPSLDKAN